MNTRIVLRNADGLVLMWGSIIGGPVRWSTYGRPIVFPTQRSAMLYRAMCDHPKAEIVTQVRVSD